MKITQINTQRLFVADWQLWIKTGFVGEGHVCDGRPKGGLYRGG